MESFEFLFWLAVFLFVVLRQAMGKKPPPEGPEGVGGPERAEETARSGRAARDPLGGMRERLLEAAREWEAEQRRRAGLPESAGRTEAESAAATLDRPAAEPGRRGASRPARPAPQERRPRGPQAPAERRPGGVRAEPGRGRPAPGRPPGRPARGREPEGPRRRPPPRTEWRDVSLPVPRSPGEMGEPVTPRPPAPEAPRSARAAPRPRVIATPPPRAERAATLDSIERYPPLKRAIILAEILGPPRALDEREGPPFS